MYKYYTYTISRGILFEDLCKCSEIACSAMLLMSHCFSVYKNENGNSCSASFLQCFENKEIDIHLVGLFFNACRLK